MNRFRHLILVLLLVPALMGAGLQGIDLSSTNTGVTSDATNGQFFVGVTSGSPKFVTMSQDCTTTNAGVVTCTKTNNVAFGPFATQTAPCTVAQGCTAATTVAGALATLLASQITTAPITVDFSQVNHDNAIPITLPTGFTQIRGVAFLISQCTASLAGATFDVWTATGGSGGHIVTTGSSTVTNNTANTLNNYQFFNTINNSNSQAYTPSSGNIQFRTAGGAASSCSVSAVYNPVP